VGDVDLRRDLRAIRAELLLAVTVVSTSITGDYPPIGDYAVIGDAHTAALVSRDGSIDWCCWPHFDSPAVFCRLLDARGGGYFRITPTGRYGMSREYIEGTNVLATTFQTDSGGVRLTDFMPAEERGGQRRGEDIAESQRLLRLLEGVAGELELEISFRPTFDYARAETTVEVHGSDAIATGLDQTLRLRAHTSLSAQSDGGVSGRLRIRQGERHWVTLAGGGDTDPGDPDAALNRTLIYWRRWMERCSYRGPYEAHVRRSALALKLLTFEPTGALVAAPTTSLPEEIGGVRNWDYRYTWLRDSALILYALQSIGYHDEALDFFEWLETICLSCQDNIQIMYRLDGGQNMPEQLLPHLEGYRGSRPVRIGNAAAGQTQLDIYGEVLDAAHLCYEGMRTPDPRLWRVLTLLADRAAARWQEPDQGIWEIRSGPRHFLYSKLLCWVALDRAVRLADEERMRGDVHAWRRTRDAMREAILTRGYNTTLQAFTQSFDDSALDASVLVIPLVGFLPPTDPRVQSTIRVIQERLTAHGLVYRYLGDDGLPGGEATFGLCTFWLVDNLALSGRTAEARELFERVLSYANDVGLLAEEIHPSSRELLGNFPQGFTHLALIRSALHIAKSEATGPEKRAERPAERQREVTQVSEQEGA
jgi:GH15 family glucan-1,4-alpha-glucosidase